MTRRRPAILCALGCALFAVGCRERAARLMGVDAAPPVVEQRAEEPGQIHFAFMDATAVTFSWRGNARSIRVWSKDMAPRTIEARDVSPKPVSMPGVWQEVVVDGLRPGTEYGYEIGRPRSPGPSSFRTPPAPGPASFIFAAFADLGAAFDEPDVKGVHRLIATGEPAFVLGLGDLTYADIRAQTSVDRHFEDVMMWSRRAAYMPVWGDHEWRDPKKDDLRNYKGRFALPHPQTSPGAPEAGCCGEDWSWFDYGNVRFIAYPEPYTDATWEDWAVKAAPLFEQAEATPALELVVTMGHRPAYSSGAEGGDARLRTILDGFGARFPKYVMNLSGHAHVYERTKPQAHVVHVTLPPGGGDLPRADTPCFWKDCKAPAFTAFRAILHGFARLTVRPGKLKLEAFCGVPSPGRDDIHCAGGDIFDHVTVSAPAAVPPPRAQR